MSKEEKRQRDRENRHYKERGKQKRDEVPCEFNRMLMEEQFTTPIPKFNGTRTEIPHLRADYIDEQSAAFQKDIRRRWSSITKEPHILIVSGHTNMVKKVIIYTVECSLGRPYTDELRKKYKDMVTAFSADYKEVAENITKIVPNDLCS